METIISSPVREFCILRLQYLQNERDRFTDFGTKVLFKEVFKNPSHGKISLMGYPYP